ncbi:PH domain-containing protein [Entamoeba marina]
MQLLLDHSLSILDVFMLFRTVTNRPSPYIPNASELFIWNKVIQANIDFDINLYNMLLTALHNQWNTYKNIYKQQLKNNSALEIQKQHPIQPYSSNLQPSDVVRKSSLHPKDETVENVLPNEADLLVDSMSEISLKSPRIKIKSDAIPMDKTINEIRKSTIPFTPQQPIHNPKKVIQQQSSVSICQSIPKRHSFEKFKESLDFELVFRGECAIKGRNRATKSPPIKFLRRTESQHDIPTISTQFIFAKQKPCSTIDKTLQKDVIMENKIKDEVKFNSCDNLFKKYLNTETNAMNFIDGTLQIVINATEIGVSAGALKSALQNNTSTEFIQNHIKYYNGLIALSTLYINTIKSSYSNSMSKKDEIQALNAFNKTFPPIITLERRILRLFNQHQIEAIPQVMEWYSKELIYYISYIEHLPKLRKLIPISYRADIAQTLQNKIQEYEETHDQLDSFSVLINSPLTHYGRIGYLLFDLIFHNSNPSHILQTVANKYIQTIYAASSLPLKKLNSIFSTDFKKKGRSLIHFGGVKIISKELKGKEWKLMTLFNDLLVVSKVDVNEKHKSEKNVLLKFENAPSGNTLDELRKYKCQIETSWNVNKLIVYSIKSNSFTLNTMICECANMKETKTWLNCLQCLGIHM